MRLVIAIGTICSLAFSTTAFAQTRTTPVEVENSPTVKIESTNNTVKAAQSGTWTVGVSGTPNVSVTNTPSVTVANTPSVSVTNTPTVGISAAANTVKPVTNRQSILFWTSNQTIENNTALFTSPIDCSGYREIRVVLGASVQSANLVTRVFFYSPSGGYLPVLLGNFATPSQPISENANFVGTVLSGGNCVFIVPVMSDTFRLSITNNTGATASISSWSWAYLID